MLFTGQVTRQAFTRFDLHAAGFRTKSRTKSLMPLPDIKLHALAG